MAFWDGFARKKREPPIKTGRVTTAGINNHGTLSPSRSITSNVLDTLRTATEQSQAINYLKGVNPDVSMAIWNFVRLANQGHEMYFYDSNGNRLAEVEAKWKEFAARVNQVSNSGLDGLIDILHQMAFVRGAQAVEVEVNEDRTDIVDIHPVIPQTITWELEDRKGRKVWIPYQQQPTKKVSLEPGKANFFWVPTDPDPDDPRGNLVMAPVIQSIDFQLQILQDLQSVLHHQGWPKNDVKILLERILESMPPDVKASAKKQQDWLKEKWDEIINTFENLEPDSDYVHFDDIEITMNQGASSGRSLDVRAITELVDTQVLNGLKQLGTFANRSAGKTETWSTVEFLIMTQGIKSIQRGSKRMIENVAKLWLRVNGMQGEPVFAHNVVNYQSEIDKQTIARMNEEFYAIAQTMGWINGDKAAQEVLGAESAVGEPSENIRISLNLGGDGLDVGTKTKEKDGAGTGQGTT